MVLPLFVWFFLSSFITTSFLSGARADRTELQDVVLGQCPAIKPALSSFSPRSFEALVLGARAFGRKHQPCFGRGDRRRQQDDAEQALTQREIEAVADYILAAFVGK